MLQEAQPGAKYGTLLAAARLGEAASIGIGCWVRIIAGNPFSEHACVAWS